MPILTPLNLPGVLPQPQVGFFCNRFYVFSCNLQNSTAWIRAFWWRWRRSGGSSSGSWSSLPSSAASVGGESQPHREQVQQLAGAAGQEPGISASHRNNRSKYNGGTNNSTRVNGVNAVGFAGPERKCIATALISLRPSLPPSLAANLLFPQ